MRDGQGTLAGLRPGDHLEQAHDRRGIEEVHAHHALPVRRGDRYRGDEQRGGVAREHAVRVDDLREQAEQLVLEREALRDGLDDQLAGCERLELGRGGDALGGLVRLLCAQPAFRGFARETLADPLHALGQSVGEGIEQQRLRA